METGLAYSTVNLQLRPILCTDCHELGYAQLDPDASVSQ